MPRGGWTALETRTWPKDKASSAASPDLPAGGRFEAAERPLLPHGGEQRRHFRAALPAGEGQAQRMEQLASLSSAGLLELGRESPPRLAGPIERLRNRGCILDQQALVVRQL